LTINPFDEIKFTLEEAQTKWHQGCLLEAYDQLQNFLRTRLLSEQLIDADLKVIQFLADLAGLLGEFSAADDLLYGAIHLYEAANSHYWADYVRLRRLQIQLDWGHLGKVEMLLQEMAPRIGNIYAIQLSVSGLMRWEADCSWSDTNLKDRTILFAELYLTMGRVLTALGQYGDALNVFDRGLFHSTQENVPSLAQQTTIPIKLAIATAHLEKGEFTQAHFMLTRLEQEIGEQSTPDYFIRCTELLGQLYFLQGEFGKALEYFHLVQTNCRALGARRATARSTLNLAHTLILLNQTSNAEQFLREVRMDAFALKDDILVSRVLLLQDLSHARKRSSVADSPSVISMLRNQADASPMPDVLKNFDRLPQSPSYFTWFGDRALAFRWQLSMLNFSTAKILLDQIKKVFQTDSQLIQVQIRVLEGTLAYYEQKIQKANTLLEEARQILQDMGLNAELWQVQRILGWCRAHLNYPNSDQATLAESTNALLTKLTESLPPQDRAIYLLNKWTADEEYLAFEIKQIQQSKDELSKSSFWHRPWRWFKLKRRLYALVNHLDQYKDVLAKRTIKQQPALFQSLSVKFPWRQFFTYPKDRVTLSFLVLPDRLLIVKIGRFRLDFQVILITRLAIRNLVQKWHQSAQASDGGRRDISTISEQDYQSRMTSITNEQQKITNQLAILLGIPKLLNDLPSTIRALTIVPDDILHGFPFSTIIYQDKPLITRYAICIAYESSHKHILNPVLGSKSNALVVGVSQGDAQLQPLLGVKQELDQIHKWLERYPIKLLFLENKSANKSNVITALSQANILHIACHGIFETNRPDQSGLVFITASGKREVLTLKELSECNLENLRHATLSSCWSADHFILPGRWIISLPETLWRSGTQSILGSLWEVYDQFAIAFMTRFYSYSDKFSLDEALRLTQVDCLHSNLPNCGNIDTKNPIFWAGFCLYGDYTKIRFSKSFKKKTF
jgi:CHAT domain-containing protein/tetratricopeptide (TPR) repeat protein